MPRRRWDMVTGLPSTANAPGGVRPSRSEVGPPGATASAEPSQHRAVPTFRLPDCT